MLTNLQIFLIGIGFSISLSVIYFFLKTRINRKEIFENTSNLELNAELKQGLLNLDSDESDSSNQELIIMQLHSIDGSNFDMEQVFELLKNLKFKAADGFFVFYNHSLEEVFRLANKFHPGSLEKKTQPNTLIAAIDLLKSNDPMSSLELMIKTLSLISESLEANITDSKNNLLSKQMIEHFRTYASRILQEKSYPVSKLNQV